MSTCTLLETGMLFMINQNVKQWTVCFQTSALCLPLQLVVFLEEQPSGFAKR